MAGRGQPRTGGRKKGTPNRLTRDLRGMIEGALRQVGGQDYLARCAEHEEPRVRVAFLTLVGKLLPREVKAEVNTDEDLAAALDRARLRVLNRPKKAAPASGES